MLKEKYYYEGWEDALYTVLDKIHDDVNMEDVDDVEYYITHFLLKEKENED